MCNEGVVGDVVVDFVLVKCLYQLGYIVDFLLMIFNSQVMCYNLWICYIYEVDLVMFVDFLCKFNYNVFCDVINELVNNKYDIIIDFLLFDIFVYCLWFF